MPNWVYNTIRINDALTDKQKQILEQIKQKGLCEYYLPMPTTLNITSGSAVDNARKILGDEFGTIPKDKGNLTDKDFEGGWLLMLIFSFFIFIILIALDFLIQQINSSSKRKIIAQILIIILFSLFIYLFFNLEKIL